MDKQFFLHEQFTLLKKSFLDQWLDLLNGIEKTWRAYVDEPTNPVHCEELHELLRDLMHSSHAFGLATLNKCTHAMERILSKLRYDDMCLTDDLIQHFQRHFSQLNHAFLSDTTRTHATDFLMTPSQIHQIKHDINDLYIDSTDIAVLKIIDNSLAASAQHIKKIMTPLELTSFDNQEKNALAIVDLSTEKDPFAKLDRIAQWQKKLASPVPIIFITHVDTLQLRLEAVRAGGEGYLVKPFDADSVIACLDTLVLAKEATPYRILIVDNQQSLNRRYNQCLTNAGMLPHVLTNPFDIIPALTEFKPELILLDVDMPRCKGYELAKVIRQFNHYIEIPIIFLTSVIDAHIRHLSLKTGDDYLVKSTSDADLIHTILLRVERARYLANSMATDSLTGLLNQQKIKSCLETELERAKRYDMDLSIAIIDLDHFKCVNDTYGHLTGDKILKAMARLLKTQIRRTDIPGRYGGEEFLIVFPETNEHTAKAVVEKLKQHFESLEHCGQQPPFSVTFSAGIASAKSDSTLNSLIDEADRAMYVAKEAGRNRVEMCENHVVSC